MLLDFAIILLVLAVIYLWLDQRVQWSEATQRPTPPATYACRQCGQPVEMAATVRPIRLTLLCPEHYHAQYGALQPLPGPKQRRGGHQSADGRRPTIPLLPRR
jgi:hypothetical protein